jgi:hypothetical protein
MDLNVGICSTSEAKKVAKSFFENYASQGSNELDINSFLKMLSDAKKLVSVASSNENQLIEV